MNFAAGTSPVLRPVSGSLRPATRQREQRVAGGHARLSLRRQRRVFFSVWVLVITLLPALAGGARAESEPWVLRMRSVAGAMWLLTTRGAWQLDSSHRVTKRWLEEDGIPARITTDVASTVDGKVWVATPDGVAVREGERFVAAGDGLPSTDVTCLLSTRRGELYAGTGRGLARRREGGWDPVFETHQFGRDRVTALVESPDGGIWAAKTHSLMRIGADGTTAVLWLDPLNPGEVALPSTAGWSLAYDADGLLWFANEAGLSVLAGVEVRWHQRWRPPPWGATGLPAQRVWSVSRSREGTMWVTFGDGRDHGFVARRQSLGGEWQRVPLKAPDGEVFAYDVVEDEAGLWVATSRGLYRLDGGELIPWPLAE